MSDLREDNVIRLGVEIVTEKKLAEMLDVSETTLTYWRSRQEGPPFIKMGKFIRYDMQDVRAWLREQKA